MDTEEILAQLRSEREQLDTAIAALESLEGIAPRNAQVQRAPVAVSAAASKRGRRRPMSAAARKRLSELMKKRWAARKKA